MKTLIRWVKNVVPYYIKHAVIAILIQVVLALVVGYILGPVAGAISGTVGGGMCYVGREVRDYQKLGQGWDLPGLISPVVAVSLVYLAYRWFA